MACSFRAIRPAVALGLFCSIGVATSFANESGPRPNILLIVSDDQGYNDLGLLGNGIQTPNLDQLAREGTRLTQFYVTWPACTPSRGSLLTGRYPQRNGVYDMIRNEAPDYGYKYTPDEYVVSFERIGGMDVREILIPRLLKQSGYRSAIFGKWDLGSLKRFLPTSRGFDQFYGFVNTGIDYYTHERYGVPSMYRNGSPTVEDRGIYCTDLFEREARRFLKETSSDVPFFLYLPFNAPHNSSSLNPAIRSTVQAPDQFKRMYPKVETETRVRENYRYDAPVTVASPEARRRDYRAAVTCMDQSIGNILDDLRGQNRLDNTIVVFFSDNGGSGGADNSPLRGRKGQLWEGGIRVPCIVRWPDGGIPAGAVCDEFLTSLELLPSFVNAAGVPFPADLERDGFDWWATLRGETPSPRNEMFWQRKSWTAARIDDWKWVDNGSNQVLYDLQSDPSETKNLSDERPEVMAMFGRRVQAWHDAMKAAEPRGPFRDF